MIGIVCRSCRSPQVRIVIGNAPTASAAIDDDVVLRPSALVPRPSCFDLACTAQFNEPAEVFLISPTAVCQQKDFE